MKVQEAHLVPKVRHAPENLCNQHGLSMIHSDTSHVPCKFFRSGQCQAGKACPFSHSTDVSTVDTPCKYFSKVCPMLSQSRANVSSRRHHRRQLIWLARAIVNSAQSARWHTFFPTDEESIDRMEQWEDISTWAAESIRSHITTRIQPWQTHFWLSRLVRTRHHLATSFRIMWKAILAPRRA